jgi:HPt (histidine-containing phosphotransfer) domain-containing protein
MAQDEQKCRDFGCSGFLPKPISRERLYAVIADAVPCNDAQPRNSQSNQKARIHQTTSTSATANTVIPDIPVRLPENEWTTNVEQPGALPVHGRDPGDSAAIESSLPMDDEDFVAIASMFVKALRSKIEMMEAACKAQDYQELYELGHWLKGSGGSAGFDVFNKPGKQLEISAKANDLTAVQRQVGEIREMANRIRIESRPPATA